MRLSCGGNVLSRLFSLALCLSTAACTLPYHTAQIDPPDATLKGVAQTLKEEGEVDMVLIHGMGPHSATTFAAEISGLATQLGRSFDAAAFINSPGIPLPHGGSLLIASLGGGEGKLTLYAILWSPVDLTWKQGLCYDASRIVSEVCTNPKLFTNATRASLNGYMKSVVLDGALADVVYYVSPEGSQTLRETVEAALLIILDGGTPNLPEAELLQRIDARDGVALFEMSESLGSKILRDSLILLATEGQADAKAAARQPVLLRAVGRNRALFMAANQIPILSPTSTPEVTSRFSAGAAGESSAAKAATELHGFAALVRAGRLLAGRSDADVPVKLVAFSDPNDLFTYALRPYFQNDPIELPNLIDVTVSNDWTYAWVIEDPWTAHTDYWQTRDVKRIVKCGLGASAQGCE
jgi:hypothetical protein